MKDALNKRNLSIATITNAISTNKEKTYVYYA